MRKVARKALTVACYSPTLTTHTGKVPVPSYDLDLQNISLQDTYYKRTIN